MNKEDLAEKTLRAIVFAVVTLFPILVVCLDSGNVMGWFFLCLGWLAVCHANYKFKKPKKLTKLYNQLKK